MSNKNEDTPITTLTPEQVGELSDEERHSMLQALLGDDAMKAVDAYTVNEESKARNKRIRVRARQLCGAVDGVDGDKKYTARYKSAMDAVEKITDEAGTQARQEIYKADGLDSEGKVPSEATPEEATT